VLIAAVGLLCLALGVVRSPFLYFRRFLHWKTKQELSHNG
jgi:hypothetical protein